MFHQIFGLNFKHTIKGERQKKKEERRRKTKKIKEEEKNEKEICIMH